MSLEIKNFLKLDICREPVEYKVRETLPFKGYSRELIEYRGREDDSITAFLFVPTSAGPHPAVLAHHQHNGERHLGKSEIAGIKGSPLQAFGPELAKRGFVVLAPDSICFEDRRKNKQGTEADVDERDWIQHFNEMTYRLVLGDTLMRKVLDDASIGLSLLFHSSLVDKKRLGVFGHSYGGNTALFQAALDARVAFTCSSGAACTFKNKMQSDTSFEFALAIPGFHAHFDFDDLVKSIAPREILLVSATEDKYSKDADVIFESAKPMFEALQASEKIQQKRYDGGHALTEERFQDIVEWISNH